MNKNIVMIECLLLLLPLLAVPSHELNQRQSLGKLLEVTTSSKLNHSPWSSTIRNGGFVEYSKQDGSQESDLITALPGQPPNVGFKQYSGYITVDSSHGRALFYYFTEATQDPSTMPLVLWLNGGPGCSSLGYGAMTELGPFRVNPDGKTLSSNPYAWNQVANVLFLESPAGVGFSYSNTTDDYNASGDKRTGHYIPELADTIINNNNGSQTSFINFKGILIGNGLMHSETDNEGSDDYLMSDQGYEGIKTYCSYSDNASYSNECDKFQSMINIEDIDPYNIYGPLCTSLASSSAALHANVTALPYEWSSWSSNHILRICPSSSGVLTRWNDSPRSMLPIYQHLMASGLRILIYRYSINALKLPIKTSWYPWMNEDEVGGYSVIYEGLTFATVRGAGHEVPSYQPARSLTMAKFFLGGKPLPTSTA
eukprot:Gb_20820 [translate_table: standard]